MEHTIFWSIVIGWMVLDGGLFIQARFKKGSTQADRHSKWQLVVWVLLGVGFGLLFFWPTRHQFHEPYFWYRWVGLFIMLLGLSVRWTAIWQLKSAFSVDLDSLTGHLISTGVYRWIRHPSYLGEIALFLGFALILGQLPGFLLMMTCVLIGFVRRIHQEEHFLLQHSPEYDRYRRNTWRLVPFIY